MSDSRIAQLRRKLLQDPWDIPTLEALFTEYARNNDLQNAAAVYRSVRDAAWDLEESYRPEETRIIEEFYAAEAALLMEHLHLPRYMQRLSNEVREKIKKIRKDAREAAEPYWSLYWRLGPVMGALDRGDLQP